ncbi:hypothetical protein BXO88_05125 [Oribacterium sp. C9]|uniref:HTH domain-containing protein n=1 Tax=Oribacterium sp. C9 TaxID=1943579 RepID=UPI00098FC099|nr:HTH domain-containing protein [Oribacterium sp. C9]OON87249.1 hypothetical protein BXO88_05125 [Oribacterium sp. C9]
MYENDKNKSTRILSIYSDLLNDKVLKKKELAEKFDVNEKTIQRDLDDIRQFLDNRFVSDDDHNDLIYDYTIRGYHFEHINRMKFSNDEVLAICKILLDSRAFRKEDMKTILDKLLKGLKMENLQVHGDLLPISYLNLREWFRMLLMPTEALPQAQSHSCQKPQLIFGVLIRYINKMKTLKKSWHLSKD